MGIPVEVLEEALEAGITLFQFREKGENALTGPLMSSLLEIVKDFANPTVFCLWSMTMLI